MLCGSLDIPARRVDNDDTQSRGSGDIDIVDAHTSARNDFESASGIE
jgi:hypothetical protein